MRPARRPISSSMNESTNTADQNQILGFLARVDRRLRVNEAIEALTFGIWGLCAVLLLLRLFGVWENPTPRAILLLIYGVALLGFVVWSFSRRKGLSTPARVADERSDTKDALTSSLDFIGLSERTRWMDFQIRRSAGFAAGLSPTEIAPTVLPRPLYYASGIALGLAACSATDKVARWGDASYTGKGPMGTGVTGNAEGQGGPSANVSVAPEPASRVPVSR